MGNRTSRNQTKIKSAMKQLTNLEELKKGVNDTIEKVILELRNVKFLINKIIDSRYKIDKLHTITGIGDIDLIYDEVIDYVDNSISNNLLPELSNSLAMIKTVLNNLQMKITTFNHFSKRKRLQQIVDDLINWQTIFLDFTDFIKEYNKIIEQHWKKSEAAEIGINKNRFVRKFRNLPLIKPVVEFLKEILHTETLKVGDSHQLINHMNNHLYFLENILNEAIEKLQKFQLDSIKNLNLIINNLNKKLSERNSEILKKENFKKWSKSYFVKFLEKWEYNNLQIFSDLLKGIKHSQLLLNENLKSETSITILKTLAVRNLNQFINIISESIKFLTKSWEKWTNKISLSDCDEIQFNLFLKIEKISYQSFDFLLENLQYIYYEAKHLKNLIVKNKSGTIDKDFIKLALTTFFNLVEKKLEELEINYKEKNVLNSDFFLNNNATNNLNFNQTENFNKMFDWINYVNEDKKFSICDFNSYSSDSPVIFELKSQVSHISNSFNSFSNANSEVMNQPEIKYSVIGFFLILLILLKKFCNNNSRCTINKANKCSKAKTKNSTKFKLVKNTNLDVNLNLEESNFNNLDFETQNESLVPLNFEISQKDNNIVELSNKKISESSVEDTF